MPNHDKPIEDSELWDILDWDVVAELSVDAGSSPSAAPLAAVAKKLIETGAKPGKQDEQFFHKLFTRFVTAGSDAARREQACSLALLFGAKPERLIDFVAFKWGLFKRLSHPKR